MPRPELHLLTASTMNGWKPLIFLEEVEAEYELTHIQLGKNEQKEEWYLELNPNGRIPTLVDRGNHDFVVFESGAILWYLAERFERFLPSDSRARSQALQWLMWQMSGVGPMMGQAMYFQRIAAPNSHRDDFAIERYVKESRRLLEILDRKLSAGPYVLGETYSIVDMAMYPYARSYPWARVFTDDLHHLHAWFHRLDDRPAIQRAVSKPRPVPAFFGLGDEEQEQRDNARRFQSH